MLVFGGFNAEGIRIDDLWSYDIESNAWWQLTARGPWPEARMFHSAVFSRNWGTMRVFGGLNATRIRLDNLWSYDIESNAWSQLTARGPSPPARTYHSAVFSERRGTMLVFGGFNAERIRLDDL